jgi:hypothetical protein
MESRFVFSIPSLLPVLGRYLGGICPVWWYQNSTFLLVFIKFVDKELLPNELHIQYYSIYSYCFHLYRDILLLFYQLLFLCIYCKNLVITK